MRLSVDRASAVKRYLSIAHGADENRIRAQGFGSSRPMKRLPGETDRSYEYRLPRVELHLVSESL
jgi:outer membrane protein OmpA-like peptidoglycan-associated protein